MQISVFSIVNTIYPYYDAKAGEMSFKYRPALVLCRENDSNNSDLTVIPISKVNHKKNLNMDYDIMVKRCDYPYLNLDEEVSYFRVHKVFTINSKDCRKVICDDIRYIYKDLSIMILEKFERFYGKVIDGGLDF